MTDIDTIRNRIAYELYKSSTEDPLDFTPDLVDTMEFSDFKSKAKIFLRNLADSNITVVRLNNPVDLPIKNSPDNSHILYRLLETSQISLADHRTYNPAEPNSLSSTASAQLDDLLSRLKEFLT